MGTVQVGIIFALLFSLVIAVFALANMQPIVINYLFGQDEISVVLIILGSAALGALTIGVLNLVWRVKTGFRFREYERKVENLSEKVSQLEVERDKALAELANSGEAGISTDGEEEAAGDDPSPEGEDVKGET